MPATSTKNSIADEAALAADVAPSPPPQMQTTPAPRPVTAPTGPAPGTDQERNAQAKSELRSREQACTDMVGRRVRYFMSWEPTGRHFAAIVVDAAMNGAVSVKFFHPGGGEGMDRRNVRPACDTQLKTNLHYQKLGCWEWMDGEQYPEKFKSIVAETKK